MAKIKCRYSIPYCDNALRFQDDDYDHDDELHFDEFVWCDPFGGCEYYQRPEDADEELFNPLCKYCKFREGEFEKTVKNYKYYDGTLTIAGREYTSYEIDYLEIDGRVLVGGDADEG